MAGCYGSAGLTREGELYGKKVVSNHHACDGRFTIGSWLHDKPLWYIVTNAYASTYH
jgi:hypothetical protein